MNKSGFWPSSNSEKWGEYARVTSRGFLIYLWRFNPILAAAAISYQHDGSGSLCTVLAWVDRWTSDFRFGLQRLRTCHSTNNSRQPLNEKCNQNYKWFENWKWAILFSSEQKNRSCSYNFVHQSYETILLLTLTAVVIWIPACMIRSWDSLWLVSTSTWLSPVICFNLRLLGGSFDKPSYTRRLELP